MNCLEHSICISLEVSRNHWLKKSVFYLDKQKSFVLKQIGDMLVIATLKCKISDFLNSNTCFCLQLCSNWNIKLKTLVQTSGKRNSEVWNIHMWRHIRLYNILRQCSLSICVVVHWLNLVMYSSESLHKYFVKTLCSSGGSSVGCQGVIWWSTGCHQEIIKWSSSGYHAVVAVISSGGRLEPQVVGIMNSPRVTKGNSNHHKWQSDANEANQ